MDRAEIILDAVRVLYDAVLEPDGWAEALQRITAAAGGDKAVFLGEDMLTGRAEFAFGAGLSHGYAARFAPACEAGMVSEWLDMFPAGIAVSASSVVPWGIFSRSRFYDETIRPMGVLHTTLALSHYAPGRRSTLAIARSAGRDDFDAAERRAVQALVPHIAAALRVRRRLGEVDLLARDAHAALDCLDTGIVIVDAAARPGFANKRARILAAASDGFSLGVEGIGAARPVETRALHRAVAAMAAASVPPARNDIADTMLAATGTAMRLRLTRPSGKPPLIVLATPLCGERWRDSAGGAARVAVLVLEPDLPPRIDEAALAEAWGLAPREAEVAALLAQGLDLRQISLRLGVGLGTAREHLKRALAKTGTHRQANLVRLVLSGFAVVLR